MFQKALDVVLPKKEANPFIPDFNFLSEQKFNIRNKYEGPTYSLKVRESATVNR